MKEWIMYDPVFESDEINSALVVSPWSGHRNFAYDMTVNIKPNIILELGTHYGCSFFAFLQAVKDFKLDTEVIAVDCWKGDEQAGYYGDEVINVVKETIEKFFLRQNCRLIRKYFNDALEEIEDGSIDILHIDGLHTYEAVTEDYEKWKCKLKENGMIMFHDVASELEYGTNKFWEEKKKDFPHTYTFKHSWGLGLLFPRGEAIYQMMEANNMSDKLQIYEYRARYNLAERQLRDHIKMVEERDEVIKKNEAMIRERDALIRKYEYENEYKNRHKVRMCLQRVLGQVFQKRG